MSESNSCDDAKRENDETKAKLFSADPTSNLGISSIPKGNVKVEKPICSHIITFFGCLNSI